MKKYNLWIHLEEVKNEGEEDESYHDIKDSAFKVGCTPTLTEAYEIAERMSCEAEEDSRNWINGLEVVSEQQSG